MKVLQQGNMDDFIENSIDVNLLSELPVGIYDVVNTLRGLMLQKREVTLFEEVTKTYGKLPGLRKKFKEEVLFYDKLGILLIGEKGSGKSLLAKQICNDSNLPIVIVKDGFDGSELGDLLNNIPNKFILFIDEFEKLFSKTSDKSDPQDKFLSILDGNGTSKFISLLTANDENKINSYFKNRTKRIKYFIQFETLNKKDVEEVLNDLNLNHDIRDKIINIHNIVGELNYDVLIEIISEFIRYPRYSLNDILYYLNIEISEKEYTMDTYAYVNSEKQLVSSKKIKCNPYLDLNIDIYPRINDEYMYTEDNDTINIDEYFNNTQYTIISADDKIIITLKKDYLYKEINFGKLEFILTPYYFTKNLLV